MATHFCIGYPCRVCGMGAVDPQKFLDEINKEKVINNGRSFTKLRYSLYDLAYNMYGDEFKYIKIDVRLMKEMPNHEDVTLMIESPMVQQSKYWVDLKGPNENNTGDMWDRCAKEEKINS